MPHYDVIIIGSGAGGGALALALAPSGKQILILERGGYLPNEEENWDPEALFLNERYKTEERWRDADGGDFRANMYYWVGGNTKPYGAAMLRLRPEDFEALPHADGLSPAWPISYADLAPYYDRAEATYLVHGLRGDDPLEPPASGPFPFAPLPHEPRIQEVTDDLRRVGIRAFALPMGINRNPADPGRADPKMAACIRCATCDGFPCRIDAKSDAQTATVDPALAYDNVTLVTHAEVKRLVTDASGRTVEAVEAVVNGEPVRYSADVVSVSAGAINSAALLLRSRSDRHPNGLANASDQVGRNFMKHITSKFYSAAPTPNPTVFQKTMAVNDYYFGGPDEHYPLGHVHLMGKHSWQMIKDDLPELGDEQLQHLAAHSLDWWVQSEDLPHVENRVTLSADGQITLRWNPPAAELAAHQRLMDRFGEKLEQIGFDTFHRVAMPLRVANHQCGTVRMGTDAATSVLDVNCRAHDVQNLYVVDASFFPSSGASNPTLTIVANAFRVAEHIREVLR